MHYGCSLSLTSCHVFLDNFYVLVPVWSGVLMVEPECVHHLMQGSAHVAQALTRLFVRRNQRQHLLAATLADVRPTPAMVCGSVNSRGKFEV